MLRTAFVFPGQGPQRPGIGVELTTRRPDLVTTYHRPADDLLGFPLSRLTPEEPEDPHPDHPAHTPDAEDPAVLHPAFFLTSVVLLDVLRSEGLTPDAVAGHGVGEYAALVAAGVLEWTDALWLVRLRGELIGSVGSEIPGATISVFGLDRTRLARLCEKSAMITGQIVELVDTEDQPRHRVVAGQARAVGHLARAARAAGALRVTDLNTGGPFHANLLRRAEAEFTEALIGTEFRNPTLPVVSSATGTRVTTAAEAVVALRTQLSGPIRWTDTVRALDRQGTDRYIEVGPGHTLGGLIRRIVPGARVHGCDPRCGRVRTHPRVPRTTTTAAAREHTPAPRRPLTGAALGPAA
ncbi:ACP S-malonyltransferase (plasmid) [Streptomyces sp. BI20]|uniref:ACP S-malonyltransferase n=1 Tax=Streptomyces sp. BI20 TaxID=3403460 RepID=UPI003C763D4C